MKSIIIAIIIILSPLSVLCAEQKKIAERYCIETLGGTIIFNIGKQIPNGDYYQIHAVHPTGDIDDFPGLIQQGNEDGVDVVHIFNGHTLRIYGSLFDCSKGLRRPRPIVPKTLPKTESESDMMEKDAAEPTPKRNEYMPQNEKKRNVEAESLARNKQMVPSVKAINTTLKVPGIAPGSSAYLALVRQRISNSWSAPPLDLTNQAYVVIVQFRLHRNGTVTGVAIEQSSGNEDYDLAGKRAVLSANPLPVFPADISDSYFDAHFTFAVAEPQ